MSNVQIWARQGVEEMSTGEDDFLEFRKAFTSADYITSV